MYENRLPIPADTNQLLIHNNNDLPESDPSYKLNQLLFASSHLAHDTLIQIAIVFNFHRTKKCAALR